MDILYIFLPIIILFGAIISYEDVTIGKIRNKWISLMVFVSILLWFILYFLKIVSLDYIFLIFIYSLAALVLGFFIWFVGLWGAGDAKSYFAFNLMIPLYGYQQGNFPFMVLLINSIVPIFLFLFIKMLIKSSMKEKLIVLKKTLNPKIIGKFMLIIFALSWLVHHLFSLINIEKNYIFSLIAILGLNRFLEKLLNMDFFKRKKIKKVDILIIICLLRIIFEYKPLLAPSFWVGFFILTTGFVIIRMFIWEMGDIFSKNIKINELKKGMVLAEMITKKGGKKKISGFDYSKLGQYNYLIGYSLNGLTKKEINKLKILHKKGKLNFDRMLVQETVPFSVFIFLGVLLTVFLKGSFLSFLLSLFY